MYAQKFRDRRSCLTNNCEQFKKDQERLDLIRAASENLKLPLKTNT